MLKKYKNLRKGGERWGFLALHVRNTGADRQLPSLLSRKIQWRVYSHSCFGVGRSARSSAGGVLALPGHSRQPEPRRSLLLFLPQLETTAHHPVLHKRSVLAIKAIQFGVSYLFICSQLLARCSANLGKMESLSGSVKVEWKYPPQSAGFCS